MSDHQRGVFFDGHDREDIVIYRNELLKQLAKLDEMTITPSTVFIMMSLHFMRMQTK